MHEAQKGGSARRRKGRGSGAGAWDEPTFPPLDTAFAGRKWQTSSTVVLADVWKQAGRIARAQPQCVLIAKCARRYRALQKLHINDSPATQKQRIHPEQRSTSNRSSMPRFPCASCLAQAAAATSAPPPMTRQLSTLTLARPPGGVSRGAPSRRSQHGGARSLLRAPRAHCSCPALLPMRRAALRPLFAALFSAALFCASCAAPHVPPLGVSAARRAHAAARGAAPPRTAALRHPRASDEQLATCTQNWFETDIDHFSWVLPRCAPRCATI